MTHVYFHLKNVRDHYVYRPVNLLRRAGGAVGYDRNDVRSFTDSDKIDPCSSNCLERKDIGRHGPSNFVDAQTFAGM